MVPPLKMQKYLYKAGATALRGSIRKPYFQDLGEHLAISTYSGQSGHIEARRDAFALFEDVKYESARTEIIAVQQGNVYTTTLTSQVYGLQIGKRLSADEITCRLQSVYDSGAYPGRCFPRILPTGSTIRNLKIDGKVQELRFPPAFTQEQPAIAAFLRGERDKDTTAVPGFIPDKIQVPDFGTIRYAEWTWAHPQEQHRQHLTMLRLSLGCDFGGEIDGGTGYSDGAGWPPISG